MLDPAAIWGTYATGRADGLMSTLPSALPSVTRQRRSRGVLAGDAGINFPSYGLVVTEATLGRKREALKRLVATQQRAWAHIKGNIQDGVDAMISQRPDARLDPPCSASRSS
jgi:NitT/TauT family transport system substrate-binding protein